MGEKKFKFDVVIGNPPYQDETVGNNSKAPSIYHLFLDQAENVSNISEFIHPARFLFNAGDTPKKWNRKVLNDEHIKVLYYEKDSSKVFDNTDIKGGIAVTYYDNNKKYDPIGTFTPYPLLNDILHKVLKNNFTGFNNIVFSPVAYKFTEKMHYDNPELKKKLSEGNEYEIKTNVFDTIPEVFFDEKPSDGKNYVKILGRKDNERFFKYIRADYIANKTNLMDYKVALPEANGKGLLGETLSSPQVIGPSVGHTQTFITIGNFDNELEALNVDKYIKTKFVRALLGTLKITQHNSISVWKNVPLQDFTSNSDIDWSKSIPEIDQQLYKKYELDEEEINFIETHVKEMD